MWQLWQNDSCFQILLKMLRSSLLQLGLLHEVQIHPLARTMQTSSISKDDFRIKSRNSFWKWFGKRGRSLLSAWRKNDIGSERQKPNPIPLHFHEEQTSQYPRRLWNLSDWPKLLKDKASRWQTLHWRNIKHLSIEPGGSQEHLQKESDPKGNRARTLQSRGYPQKMHRWGSH